MAETSIEWTEKTWNPTRGCSRVSPGCEACYAERQAARFSGPGQPYQGLVRLGKQGPRWTGVVRLVPEKLTEPLRWRKPARIFVNSMSDLFHEALSDTDIDQVLAVMLLAPHHTFQVLTKRAERMADYLNDPRLYDRVLAAASLLRDQRPELCQIGISDPSLIPAPWIWWGVSVEDQRRAEERIPHLLRVPAAVRFLSCEPLLEAVDISPYLPLVFRAGVAPNADGSPFSLPAVGGSRGVDWVIVGGESGPGARPCAGEWIESIVEQCRDAQVPVFVKQLGACAVSDARTIPVEHARDLGWDPLISPATGEAYAWRAGLNDRKGGDPSEWPEDLRVREFPRVAR